MMNKLWEALGDFTTQWREGGKGSAWSNRRMNASRCLDGFFILSAAGLYVLPHLSLQWAAIIAFIPAVASLIGSIFFSYFSCLGDLKDTVKEALAAIKAANDLAGTH